MARRPTPIIDQQGPSAPHESRPRPVRPGRRTRHQGRSLTDQDPNPIENTPGAEAAAELPGDREISDERLFETYRDGDDTALRTLIERYHDDLLRFLYRFMGDRQAAEDVLQETFLQVHVSGDSFDTSRRFRPWLFTVAANKARDALRRRARRKTLELSAPVRGGEGASYVDLMEIDIPQPGDRIEAADQGDLVQRAVDRLSVSLREVLLLAYFQRLSYAQIAEQLEIPLGTVKSRLHAAVASFAKHWSEINETNPSTPKPERGSDQ